MKVEINNYIIADDEVCGGSPVFKGTRIMAWQVLELLAAGITINEILKNYFPELDGKAISAALNYASKIMEDERYVAF
ncbi:MAG: DUF433 domain-containing protein [Candidatus Pacearchaeota archaeon]